MGAEYDSVVFDCKMDEVPDRFSELVKERTLDYGRIGYTGTFAEVDKGVLVLKLQFENEDTARGYLQACVKKWEEAWSVRFLNEEQEWRWLVVALCSA